MDIHGFYMGRVFDAYTFFGAHTEGNRVVFRTYAPNAERVAVIGDFNDWQEEEMLQEEQSGIFEYISFRAKAGMLYKYVIYNHGMRVEHCDPYGFSMELRPAWASVITDLSYDFHDEDWMQSRTRCFDRPMNIYEMHLGSWKKKNHKKQEVEDRPDGIEENGWYSYEELIPLLVPYLKENAYTHVEFMPLSEHPFDGSWGYQNTGFFSPTSRYGSPAGLKKLVDALHRENIGVIMDIVPVHFAPDSYGLRAYDGTPLYEHPAQDVGNSEWGTCNFLYSRGDVCSFIQSSANYWLEEYHFDGLRMDAISRAIYWSGNPEKGENEQATAFLRSMNQGLHALHPTAFLCAEDSTAFPGVTKPGAEGGLDFDYKWDMGWMNDTLDFFKAYPWARKDISDTLTFSMMYFYSERFLLPFSHDENVHGKATIVQKMQGDYEIKFPQARALYMYMYIHPGKKLNFMGGELGQLREWTEEQEQDWEVLKYPMHDSFHRYMQKLGKIYSEYDAFWYDYDPLNFEWADLSAVCDGVYSIYRHAEKYDILAVFNFDGKDRFNYEIRTGGRARILLCSDWEEFSGRSKNNEEFFYQERTGTDREWLIKFKVPAFSGTLFYIENDKKNS